MKKYYYILTLLLMSLGVQAQKFGYVDTEFILAKMPEFKDAQKEIDKLSIKYQKEIETKLVSLDSLKAVYKAEEILYTEEMKRKMKEKIAVKDSELREFQNNIFGFEGRIFLKRQELIKPIQDKVFTSIEKIAKKNRLQIVFDKAGELVILYAESTHDYTDFVLEDLGIGDKKDTIDNPR